MRTTPPKFSPVYVRPARQPLTRLSRDENEEFERKELRRVEADISVIENGRLFALCRLYGIKHDHLDRWFLLSLCLARNLMPDFGARFDQRKGDKRGWFGVVGLIDILRAKREMTLRKACTTLSDNKEAPQPWQRSNSATLLTRYREFLKRIETDARLGGLYASWKHALAKSDEPSLRDLLPDLAALFDDVWEAPARKSRRKHGRYGNK